MRSQWIRSGGRAAQISGRVNGVPQTGRCSSGEAPPDRLREEDHILVLGTEDDPVPLKRAEVDRGRPASRRGAMPRHGHIREVEAAVQRGDPRVFDSELLELRLRAERDVGDFPGPRPSPQRTTLQVRDEREPDQAVRLVHDDSRIDRDQFGVGNPVDRQFAGRVSTSAGR